MKPFVWVNIILVANFFFLFVFPLFYMCHYRGVSQVEIHDQSITYKYFELDHRRNENSLGIVSLFEEIEQNGFLSYSDYTLRKEILVSPFGTEEYQCFGSCFCEGDDPRRNSESTLLITGVSYLLAAVSSIVAMSMAKEHFSSKCKENYSHVCEPENIKTELEECFSRIEQRREKETTEAIERIYFCYGHCEERSNPHELSKNNHIARRPTAESEGIDCSRLRREGTVRITKEDLLTKSRSRKTLSEKMGVASRVRFQQEYLVDFCKENSKIEYFYEKPVIRVLKSTGERKEYPRKERKVGYMCTANKDIRKHVNVGEKSRKSSGSSTSPLSNVKCRQISPKTDAINTQYLDDLFWEKKKVWDG